MKNSTPNAVDPSGLILVAFDGTGNNPTQNLEPIAPEKIGGLYELAPPFEHESLDQWLAALEYRREGSRKTAWQEMTVARAGIASYEIDSYYDFSPENRVVMTKIYGYYSDKFLAHPELVWAGMAKLAGNTVWNALDLSEQFKRLAPGYGQSKVIMEMQKQLVTMNLEIALDLAWVHEAYVSGGMPELERLHATKELERDVYTAFELINEGKLSGDQNKINRGNAALLRREQDQILKRGYNALSRLQKIGLAQGMAKNSESPIPGGKHFLDVVPGGDLTKFDDRWKWIDTDMLPKWLAYSSEAKALMVSKPLGTVPNQLLVPAIVNSKVLQGPPAINNGKSKPDSEFEKFLRGAKGEMK